MLDGFLFGIREYNPYLFVDIHFYIIIIIDVKVIQVHLFSISSQNYDVKWNS